MHLINKINFLLSINIIKRGISKNTQWLYITSLKFSHTLNHENINRKYCINPFELNLKEPSSPSSGKAKMS